MIAAWLSCLSPLSLRYHWCLINIPTALHYAVARRCCRCVTHGLRAYVGSIDVHVSNKSSQSGSYCWQSLMRADDGLMNICGQREIASSYISPLRHNGVDLMTQNIEWNEHASLAKVHRRRTTTLRRWSISNNGSRSNRQHFSIFSLPPYQYASSLCPLPPSSPSAVIGTAHVGSPSLGGGWLRRRRAGGRGAYRWSPLGWGSWFIAPLLGSGTFVARVSSSYWLLLAAPHGVTLPHDATMEATRVCLRFYSVFICGYQCSVDEPQSWWTTIKMILLNVFVTGYLGRKRGFARTEPHWKPTTAFARVAAMNYPCTDK